jgi:hypothetical protein
MKRLICTFVTVLALAVSPVFAQPAPGSSAISGTVRVEKSLVGAVQAVEIVASTGEVTRVIGTARDAIAAHDGKTIEVQGPVARASDGTRTVIAETYKIP